MVLCALTILAELAFNVLGGPSGWLLGAGAVFLLAVGGPPLQRLAHHEVQFPRVAGKAERARLYREQAIIVWQDHGITRRERILLDHLRARLSLTADEAARLEQEALEATAP